MLKPPPRLPDDGVLIGYSLEHEHRTAPIGFRYAPLPSIGVNADEYLDPILLTGGGHLMTVAPTGAGKGVSCIIPTLLRFPGPTIVIDPKGENYAVTASRRKALGQKIVLLDPMGITGSDGVGAFNPLDLVDPRTAVAIDDAAMVAQLLTAGLDKLDPRNLFWYQRGEQLAAGLIQHIATSRPPGQRNLAELRRLLNLPIEEFEQMARSEMLDSPDENVRSLAGMLTNPAVEMIGSIVGMAQNSLEFLRGELVQEATDSSSFDIEAVTTGEPLSIYLVIPPDKLESHRNLLRVWIGSLMALLMRRRAPPPHKTLFMLDEAAQLGSLDQLRQAITLMRGYGMQTWSFWQDLSQLRNLYPSDWETMYNNCQVHQSFGFTNLKAAEAAADISGFYDPLEVLELDVDEMILSIAGDEAVIARKPHYLTDPAFRGTFSDNPFYKAVPEGAPRPRRPQRRYVRPRRPAAEPLHRRASDHPDYAGEKGGDPGGGELGEGRVSDGDDGTTPDMDDRLVDLDFDKLMASAEPAPSVFSARNVILASAYDDPDDLPPGVALEGYDELEVVPPAETPALIKAVARATDWKWDPYGVVARRAALPFYPGYHLYELLEAGRQPSREFVIRKGDDVVPIDWTNDVFYTLNDRVGIELNDETAARYLKVFFRFVRGRHGTMHIAETAEDVPVPGMADPEAREIIGQFIHPMSLEETLTDGTRVFRVTFYFSDSLYSTAVRVTEGGEVALTDEEVLVDSVTRLLSEDTGPGPEEMEDTRPRPDDAADEGESPNPDDK